MPDDQSRDATLTALGIDPQTPNWQDAWDASAGHAEAASRAMQPDAIDRAWRWLGLSPDAAAPLLDAATQMRDQPAMMRLATHLDWLLSPAGEAYFHRTDWPLLPERWEQTGRLFYAVVMLAANRHARARHAALGIGEDVSRETLADIALHLKHYEDRYHRPGFDAIWWYGGHLIGTIYGLGRLQFERCTMSCDFHVLQRIGQPGKLVVLAGQGMRFAADGLFADAEGHDTEAAGVWEAGYRDDGQQIIGHAMDDRGCAKPTAETFPRDAWEPVLERRQAVLGLHIPALGPLTPEACRESFERAYPFFAKHFPGETYHGFTCNSWLLDPQLGDYLPEKANIIRFQRAFFLHPRPGADGFQTVERVFPDRHPSQVTDPGELPTDTSLRRVVAEHLKAGKRWYNTGGVLPWDGLFWNGEPVTRGA